MNELSWQLFSLLAGAAVGMWATSSKRSLIFYTALVFVVAIAFGIPGTVAFLAVIAIKYFNAAKEEKARKNEPKA